MLSLIQLEVPKLWKLLPHPPGTFVRWFARKGNDRIGGGVDTVEELMLAAASAEGMNFYVAPNPAATRAGTRHTAQQVTNWSWFLIDIDPLEGASNPRPEMVMEFVLGKIGKWWGVDFNSRRPLLIHSGRGAQAWIRLDDYPFDDRYPDGRIVGAGEPGGGSTEVVTRRTARITNGFWLKKLAEEIGTMSGCRIDTTCADLPRVMRCPGTTNMRNGKTAILIVPSAEQYVGLSSTLVAAVPPELFEPVPVPVLPPGTQWQSVFVHLTLRAQSYMTQGRDEPGRHDTMFHTALCLAERGLDRDSVRVALQYGNQRWDDLHPREIEEGAPRMALKPEDIEHALDTAFRRLQRATQSDTMGCVNAPPINPQEEPAC
jgi:hypothetical protein